ncbi:MAG: DUF4198 domain-containing protein [Anaeromyxobacter sp.]
MNELLARLRVALRHAPAAPEERVVEAGPPRIDLARREVTVGGVEVRLTPTEYRVLALLARHAGKVLTHRQLLREVWGPGPPGGCRCIPPLLGSRRSHVLVMRATADAMPKLLALTALLATPALTLAHDLWVEPARGGTGFAVRYGHLGGEVLRLDPATVTSIRCFDPSGKAHELRPQARVLPDALQVDASCAAVTVVQDGGTWSLTPDGEVNLPRRQAKQAVRAWTSRQHAKWVDAQGPLAGAALGEELELVAVTGLSRVRAGDKVTVRLIARGQPVPGAVVAVDHKALGGDRLEGRGARQGPRRRARVDQRGAEAPPGLARRRRGGAGGEPHLRGGAVSGSARAALAAIGLLAAGPALAHEVLHTVERGRALAVHVVYADGEPLAYAAYELYSPADPNVPHQKGRTDRSGWVAFVPDVAGSWRLKVTDATGHGLDVQLDAGAPTPEAGGPPGGAAAFVLRPLLGIAAILAVFGLLIFFHRRRSARA